MSEQNDDTTLAKSAASGDHNAFEALLSRHYGTIYKMAYRWCGNQADAEDITQNTCIKLARAIGTFRGEAAFTSWLYRLVINTAKDWQRQQSPRPEEPVANRPLEVAEPARADGNIYVQQVMAEVHQLPDGEKAALLLVVSEGLSHREAADIIGCKESTISWRIHQARKKLNQLFEGGAEL